MNTHPFSHSDVSHQTEWMNTHPFSHSDVSHQTEWMNTHPFSHSDVSHQTEWMNTHPFSHSDVSHQTEWMNTHPFSHSDVSIYNPLIDIVKHKVVMGLSIKMPIVILPRATATTKSKWQQNIKLNAASLIKMFKWTLKKRTQPRPFYQMILVTVSVKMK